MLDPEVARDLLDDILGGLRVTEAEARLEGGRMGQATVRDGRLVDHRDIAWTRARVRASTRTSSGWTSAAVCTTIVDSDSVKALRISLEDALAAAVPGPEPRRLAHADELGEPVTTFGYDEAVAQTGAAFRVHTLSELAFQARRMEWGLDGRFTTTLGGFSFEGEPLPFAVANTHGVFAHHVGTGAQLILKAGQRGASPWRDLYLSEGFRRTQLEHVRGIERCLEDVRAAVGHGLCGVDDLRVDGVVLDVAAVARLVQVWSRAFVACTRTDVDGHVGEAVAAATVHVRADVTHGAHQGRPFDVEGVPTQPISLVEGGVVRGLVQRRDSATSPLATGYTSDAERGTDAASSLVLTGSDASIDDLLVGLQRGLLIRNIELSWSPGERAGLLFAPDGALRIVHGRVQGAVAPFSTRVDLQVLFGAIEAVGQERRALGVVAGPVLLPARGLGL